MKLFETSQGFIFSFGFDMITRKRDSHIIAWCDPRTKEWEPTPDNKAGYYRVCFFVGEMDFIKEIDGKVIAYRSDPRKNDWCRQEEIEDRKPMCIELTHFGHRVVWILTILEAQKNGTLDRYSHSMYKLLPKAGLKLDGDHVPDGESRPLAFDNGQ